jgi:hypothetical protein
MAATYVANLVINQNADFSEIFNLEDVNTDSALNLSGYTVSSQLRKHSASSHYVSFNAEIFNDVNGQIKVGLTTTQTSSLKPGRYVYDVVVVDDQGVTKRVVEGMVLVREGSTR